MRASVMVIALCTVLSACATGGSADAVLPSGSPSPSCAGAVPAQPGATPPAGCTPYDPDQAMTQNDAHKERMPVTGDDVASGSEMVTSVRSELEALVSAGAAITQDDVRTALTGAGLAPSDIQTLGDPGRVRFGATFAGGGDDMIAQCIHGAVDADTVTVDVGGLVMDGGCLAMDGH